MSGKAGGEICSHVIRDPREYGLRKHGRVGFREQSRIGRGRTDARESLQPICKAPATGLLVRARLPPAETKALPTHAASGPTGGHWDGEGAARWKQSGKLTLPCSWGGPCQSARPPPIVKARLEASAHEGTAAGRPTQSGKLESCQAQRWGEQVPGRVCLQGFPLGLCWRLRSGDGGWTESPF